MVIQKNVIGSDLYISVAGREKVPAKVDTGADSSAIWVSNVKIKKDGSLSFCLFGEGSPFYSGKVLKRKEFKAVYNRSSHGDVKICYRTHIPVKIDNRRIKVLFTLQDRANHSFPVLIGKRTLRNRYIVDVNQTVVPQKNKRTTRGLTRELKENPHEFHQKYILGKEK